MDHIELWDKAKALMREELANVSYTTWIEQPLKPVYVVDDKLALEVISDFNEKTIRARYLPMITEAVSQAAGREMTIELMSVKERIEWQERQKKEDAPAMQGINMFNPKSTFDTFVVGSSNRFAHAAALAVAEQPGMAYNPLFLYGGVGLGKTHLMHAIGHFIQDHFPNMRMLYLPSEMFTNELVAAIKNNKNVEFRNRFRNVDVLMLDDIQFIAGRDSTQEEFFHTFNALTQDGKQIVLSSDRPPKDMPQLEDRMRTRFEWGLLADVQPPDLETRMLIVKRKVDALNFDISDDVIEYIAQKLKNNIRQLESAVKKMQAYVQIQGANVNTATVAGETTKKALEQYPVGGIVYFAKNLEDREQTVALLENTQSYAKIPLFLGVDEEGGTVSRVGSNPDMGVPSVGDMRSLGKQQDPAAAYAAGQDIGGSLHALGFNLDFAPVADVAQGADSVIGSRSFGSDPELCASLAGVIVKSLRAEGIVSCLKHFPGYGSATVDDHNGTSIVEKTLSELEGCDLVPFQSIIASEGSVPFVMVSHLSYPNVTGSDTPADLSASIVTDILRDKLDYQNVIITDSHSMASITDHYSAGDAAVKALAAGCDMILMPSDLQAAFDAVKAAVADGTLSQARIDESVLRILTVKAEYGIIS